MPLPYTSDMPLASAAVLQLLACPVCRQTLHIVADGDVELIACDGCGRRYPVIDGIPALIPENAIEPETAQPAL